MVRGTPHGQNTQALNGVNVTDPVSTGFSDFYYDYDSFQEVQVSTGAHPIEVGSPGVYVNMVTKTGTNSLMGKVSFYYQNDSLQSDNIDEELEAQGVTKLGFDYLSDFTAQAGGPLVKDKLHFFGAYRDWRVHRFVAGFVDDAGTPVVEPTDMYSFLANATYQVNQGNRVTGFWARQAYNKPQRGASALNTPLSTWNEDDTFSIYQGIWNSILNDHAFLESRVSLVDIFFPLNIQDAAKAARNQATVELTTNKVTGANANEFINERQRLQLNTVLSWYKSQWLGARHELKFGWDFANNPTSIETTTLDDVAVAVFEGFPALAFRFNTPVRTEETTRTNAFFAADTIQRGRFTANFGLRFDQAWGILPAQSSPAGTYAPARSFDSQGSIVDWKTLSPRGGVIYQLTRDGKTAIKFHAARYYHLMSTAIPSSANPNAAGFDVVEWFDLNSDLKFQPNEAGGVLAPAPQLLTSIDPDLKAPYTNEFLFNLEREVMPNFRLSGVVSFRQEHRQVGLKDVTSTFEPVPFVDPDTGNVITIYNKSFDSFGIEHFNVINSDQLDQDYKGFEIIANKRLSNRWELLGSYSVSKAIQEQVTVSGDIYSIGAIPVDPNNGVNARGPIFWDRTHMLKLSGSYLFGWDILASANLLVQSGPVFTRTVMTPGDFLNQGPVTVFAEPRDESDRLDTLSTMDLRGSKQFRFGNRSFEALVEVYNLFNANTVLDANTLTGPAFGSPLTVLSPRIIRFGGRFLF